MLSDENGVAAHRSLSPIICRHGKNEAFGDEVASMLQQGFKSTLLQIVPFPAARFETGTKVRLCQAGKGIFEVTHGRAKQGLIP